MNNEPSKKISQITRSLRRFSDYADDLSRADMSTFEDRLGVLIAFCKTDEVFQNVHAQLSGIDEGSVQKWCEERLASQTGMVGSGDLIFPTNEDERLSTMYWLLLKANGEELDAANFAGHFYSSGRNNINDNIRFFCDTVVVPLKRDIAYKFEEMLDDLPTDPASSIPLTHIQIIEHAQNVIQQSAHGSNISQDASIRGDSELDVKFEALRKEILKNISISSEQEDALEASREAQELINLNPPKKSAAKRILGTIPALGSIGSIISGISVLL